MRAHAGIQPPFCLESRYDSIWSFQKLMGNIKKYENQIYKWRSSPDNGQAAAINEGMIMGSAPYVCWLNSDDMFLHDGLKALLKALETASPSDFESLTFPSALII